jgi:dynein assembly factor with WDR repeat domains 1
VRKGTCVKVFSGHTDEVLDLNFNSTGTKLASASADGTCKVYNVSEA